MRRVSIIVSKEQLTNLLTYAGQEQLLHLVTVPEGGLPKGVELFGATTILARSTTIKNRLSSIIPTLVRGDTPLERIEAPLRSLDTLADFLDKETVRLEQSVLQLEDSARKLQTGREQTRELARFLFGLESFGVTLDAIGGKDFLTILPGEAPRESIRSIQAELDEVTYGNLIFALASSSERAQTFLAIFPNAFQEDARQAATSLGAKLEPQWGDLPADITEAKKLVNLRLGQIEEMAKRLDQDQEILVKELGPRCKGLSVLSEILEIRARALSNSSTTEATCLIQAWVPQDQVGKFAEGAAAACQGMVSVHEESKDTHGEDEPPTLIRAPEWAKPLQSVINNFGVASYREINPLPFMLVSYPVIFGLMFGDFGQGPLFILLGLFLWRLKKKGAKVPDIVQMLVNGAELIIMLGVGITFFGLIFGDFFGFEPDFLKFRQEAGQRAPIFSPSHHLEEFMVITLFLGVGHYTFGLGLSAYNKFRNREYSEAFFGPICWAWFYVAGVYLVSKAVLAGFNFSVVTRDPLSMMLVVVPLVLLGWKEGPLQAFEAFLSSASNTFSYLRIWALNIADFYFKFALFFAMGIPGAILGNILVMVIEGLIVFVQTLRLHWVEWFGKFYEGSGLSFAPYQEPIRWTVVSSA